MCEQRMSEGKEEEKRASKSRFKLSEEEREAVYRQLEERYGPDWRHKVRGMVDGNVDCTVCVCVRRRTMLWGTLAGTVT